MSVTHRSLSVAVESAFGSLSASTGLPDNSGLTFTSIPCERDPIIVYGDPVVAHSKCSGFTNSNGNCCNFIPLLAALARFLDARHLILGQIQIQPTVF